MKKNFIQVKNVSFRIDKQTILSNITVTVAEGSYVGIIGPNGGGKSTLLKIMLGLLRPTSGSITIFGTPLEQFRDWNLIGYVPQRMAEGKENFPATVEEIVRTGRTPLHPPFVRFTRQDHDAIAKALSIAGIQQLRHRQLQELSGGERQRVFIARALAQEPKMLMLDEPSSGIDIGSQEKLYAFIQELHRKHGLTVVMVSHDIDVITHEVESVICLRHGLIGQVAPHQFLREGFLKKLYGEKATLILHQH